MSTTAAVTVPEAGRVVRYALRCAPGTGAVSREYLMFVTKAEVYSHTWIVRGYKLRESSYVLTDEEVTESGSIGRPDGVREDAFCVPARAGDRGAEQYPLFSDRFPASDASLVRAAEIAGRRKHLAVSDERISEIKDALDEYEARRRSGGGYWPFGDIVTRLPEFDAADPRNLAIAGQEERYVLRDGTVIDGEAASVHGWRIIRPAGA